MTILSSGHKEQELNDPTGLQNPVLALGLSGISDWGTNMPFINLMNQSRAFYANEKGQGFGGISTEELYSRGYINDEGWPTGIPEDADSIATFFHWSHETSVGREGTYRIQWEGEANIRVNGGAITESASENEIWVTLNGGYWELEILDIGSKGVQNISIVKDEHIELFEVGAIFNPDFVEKIADVRQLRFMDMSETNFSLVRETDNPLDPDHNWRTQAGGIPIEYQVALANQIGADPWIVIPHMANDNYIEYTAKYVRDNLNKDLTATIEYSNETWNWGFRAPHHHLAMAQENWGTNHYTDYHTKLAVNTATIFSQVFSEKTDVPNLVNVLATQVAHPGMTAARLEASNWKKSEPDLWVDPAEVFDALAIATYFGGKNSHDAKFLNDLKEVVLSGNVDVNAWIYEQQRGERGFDVIQKMKDEILVQTKMAQEYGMPVVSYEGGNHTHHTFGTQIAPEILEIVGPALSEYSYSEEMANLYSEAWEIWKDIGFGPFMQFGGTSAAQNSSTFNTWRHLEDENPKSKILEELNAEETPWWTDEITTDTFRQGRTEYGDDAGNLLVGTMKSDFLIGRDGDDIFVPGAGSDGLHGGEGIDLVIFDGLISSYAVTQLDSGTWLIEGDNGANQLKSVEYLTFNDREEIEIEAAFDISEENRVRAEAEERRAAEAAWMQENATLGVRVVDDYKNLTVHSDTASGLVGISIPKNSKLGREIELGSVKSAAYLLAQDSGLPIAALKQEYRELMKNPEAAFATALVVSAIQPDSLQLTSNNDLLLGQHRASDIVRGGLGDDKILGRSGADSLAGGMGNDSLRGGWGEDTIEGGPGSDSLFGGLGSDLFIGGVNDNIYGGRGKDTLNLNLKKEQVEVLKDGDSWKLSWSEGDLSFSSVEQFQLRDGEFDINRMLGYAAVGLDGEVLSALGDEVAINASSEIGIRVVALNPYSTVSRELNDDLIYHASELGKFIEINGEVFGANYWSVNEGSQGNFGDLFGETAVDGSLLFGSLITSAASLRLTDHSDYFSGRTGDDVAFGGSGEDTLIGGSGMDALSGGTGDDTLTGGHDPDSFVFEMDNGNDVITDFERKDWIVLEEKHQDFSELFSTSESGNLLLKLEGGSVEFLGLTLEDASWVQVEWV